MRLPALKVKLGLSDGQLGLQVLGWGFASIVAMNFSGAVLRRWRNRRVLGWCLPAVAVSLIPVGLADSFAVLIAAGLVFGLCYGMAEVAATTAAVGLERATRRALLGSMHAYWSVGAVVGGLAGAAGAGVGLSFTSAMLITSGVGLVAALLLGRRLPDEPAEPLAPRTERSRMPRSVWWLGAVMAGAFLAEGAIADWGPVYLVGFAGTSQAVAALAFPLTEAAVIVARLTADRLSRLRPLPRLILLGSLGGAVGSAIVAVAPGVRIALLGFVVVGATVAVIPPLTLSAAGALSIGPGAAAIGRVSAIGYSGFLVGPVLIGVIADRSSLATGFVFVAAICILVAGASFWVRADR